MKKIITLLALISFGTSFVQAQNMNMSMDTPEGSVNMGLEVKESPDGGVQMNMRMDTPEGTVNTAFSADEKGMNTNMRVSETQTTNQQMSDLEVANPASLENVESVSDNPNRCMSSMSASDFSNAQRVVNGKTFEDDKIQIIKQIADENCFSAAQVKALLGLLTYEESKLAIAKHCYLRTTDRKNYYIVNDAFTYSSSVEDLHTYMSSVK